MERHAKITTLPDGTLCLFVPTQSGSDLIRLSEITFLLGMSNRTAFFLTDDSTLIVMKSLMYWGEPLLKHGFARVSKTNIINLLYFEHYQKGNGGYVKLVNVKDTITVARRYKRSFLHQLYDELSDGSEEHIIIHPDK